MESSPLLRASDKNSKVSTSIRVRMFNESDTERIKEIYIQAMLYDSNSPAYVALRSQFTKPLAFVLYSIFALGLLLSYLQPTRIAGVLISIVAITLFFAWRILLWSEFKNFIEGAANADLSNLRKHYAERPGGFWVATTDTMDGGELIIGCVGLDATKGKEENTAEVKRMVIDPSHQRLGIGRLLMTALVEHAKENGLANITLSTSMFQPGAMLMYERLGFTKVKQEWMTVKVMAVTVDKAYVQFYRLAL